MRQVIERQIPLSAGITKGDPVAGRLQRLILRGLRFHLHSQPGTRLGVLSALLMFLLCPAVQGEQIPSSFRSINIIAKVQPDLSRDYRSRGFKFGAPIFIRIFKEERELEVWIQGQQRFRRFRTYYVCDYSEKLGPKIRSGDCNSPEGFYCVTPDQLNPNSHFYLAFDIGYPNAYDLAHGRTGNKVMVHGSCYSKGCFAMTNGQMEEIYAMADAALRNGQPCFQVHIFPFRMTESNMERHRNSKWYGFWTNLKRGYDYFES